MSLTPHEIGTSRKVRSSFAFLWCGLGLVASALLTAGLLVLSELWPLALGGGIGLVACFAIALAAGRSVVSPTPVASWARTVVWTYLRVSVLGVAIAAAGVGAAAASEGMGGLAVAGFVIAGVAVVVAVASWFVGPGTRRDRTLVASALRPGEVVMPAVMHIWPGLLHSYTVGQVVYSDPQGRDRFALKLVASGIDPVHGFVVLDAAAPDRPQRFVHHVDQSQRR